MNNLEQSITLYGKISSLAYDDSLFTANVNSVTIDDKEYEIIDWIDDSVSLHNPLAGDFQAILLKNGNEYVLAFRGTDGIVDGIIDTMMTIYSPQLATALLWTNEMIEKHNIDKNHLTLTGHSLGGILTQYVGSELEIKGYAYNPWGINTLFTSAGNSINQIIDKALGNIGIDNKTFAKNNIYNISYQDEGFFNGDPLSNLATGIISEHLGTFIPIFGKNVDFANGHYMKTLNEAIEEYNTIVKKFDNSCRYEDITNMYLSTAIIHGKGYERVQKELTKIGISSATDNSLHLNVITPTSSVTSIFSGSNLSTPALYALVNLNPFIVSGVNSNAYAELEKYKAEYSENYVSDKAKMFKALMDTPKVGSYYDDYETGKKISYYTSVTDPDSTDEYNLTDTAYTFGTNKNDIVTASVGKANRIYTLAGDDTITLTSGSNYIEAGSGNDTIDLSGITDKNSTNIIYADLKDSDDKDSGNDIIIGSAGKDTMYGGSGFDSYYAGSGDTIEDDDKGQGFVYFNSNSPLTGGTYDKDKGCYVGGIYEYHLNGKTLIVKDTTKDESITINNYHKDKKSLDIDLIKADEIDIIISNATVTEGDENEPNKDGKAPYNTTLDIKLNRKLKEDEFIIIQKYNYKKQATELVLFGTLPKDYDTTLFKNLLSNNKTLDFSWYGNKTKEEDKKYCVGGVNIFAKSDNLTIRDIKPGYVTIKDDDKDPNDDEPEKYDPLVIDLNNDGIKGTNLDYKINFDLDNNGFKEATSWIDNNDAFIAIDKNNNGTIDNGSELFGNKSISNNAYAYTNPNAKNGFESLKEFDSNNDGIIDEKDKEFTNLLLWQDKNSNGISETDELIKLSDKVKSINLNYTKNGNAEISSATLQDGSSVKVQDMYFNVDLKKSEEIINSDKIPSKIKVLPNIIATGNLHSLHSAMAKNETLVNMMNLYLLMDSDTRKENIDTLIYEWAGVGDLDKNARTTSMDSRRLAVYEKLMGKPFTWHGKFDDNNVGVSATLINDIYNKFSNFVYATIELNTTYSYLNLDFDILKFDENLGKYNYDFSNLNLRIQTLYNENKLDELKNLSIIIRTSLTYKPFANSLLKENYLNNFKDNKELLALLSGTFVIGTNANDTLNGTNEADYLKGLGGNDSLYGGYGDDIYEFNGNFGSDTIYDTAGKDSIYLDINSDRISLKRELANLIIQTKDEAGELSDNKITIQNYFNINPEFGNGVIENIKFADGTIWSVDDILANAPLIGTDESDKFYLTDGDDKINALGGDDTIYGGNGNDTINGDDGDDTLYGDDGNDTLIGGKGNDNLYGGNGNDTITGGTGNDNLQGGYGNDTYIFSKGDGVDTIVDYGGSDTIKFNDFNQDDIKIKRELASLIITSKISDDKITIQNFFDTNTNTNNPIEKIIFKDSSEWNLNEILKNAPLLGTDENDTFYLTSNDDEFDALSGDDIIHAGNGNDTINGGNGNDTIYAGNGDDNVGGDDGNDALYGDSGDDTLYGGSGNDNLQGDNGNDTLIGGKGNDNLYGGYGDDTYIFNIGDGNDTIYEYNGGGYDTIKFGEGISKDDLIIEKTDYYNLKICFKNNSTDSITLNGLNIENFEFANGDKLSFAHIQALPLYASDESETIYGYYDKANTINALGGDDTIYGGNGDTITGGTGNDNLQGGYGNDTYIFSKGDGVDTIVDYGGSDTIKFNDFNQDDIKIKRELASLIITSKISDDKITIQNFFDINTNNPIEKIIFKDSSEWNLNEILKNAPLLGTDENDTFYLTSNDDEFDALSGDDIIHAGNGNDTINGGNGNDTIYAGNGNDTIIGGKGNDTLNGGNGNDTINGDDGNDALYGDSGDDTLYGGAGNDSIYDSNGNDTITGGTGNDNLQGGYGNDTYIFSKGDGVDTIVDYGGSDTIKFNDFNQDDIKIKRELASLIITSKISDDKITIQNFFDINTNNPIEKIIFKDSSEWNLNEILKNAPLLGTDENDTFYLTSNDDEFDALSGDDIIHAGNGNDTINGGNGNDTIYAGNGDDNVGGDDGDDTLYGDNGDDTLYGGAGNDNLQGNNGNDTLIGGTGNDTLNGGNGDDTYIYNLGDGVDTITETNGNDTIKFGEGINKDDLIVQRVNSNGEINTTSNLTDIKISFKSSPNDSVILKSVVDANVTNSSNAIENFEFKNGDKLSFDDIKKLSLIGLDENETISGYSDQNNTIYGNAGDDTLNGKDKDDTLYGGAGNDNLQGNNGNDTLIGGTGNDTLNGGNGDDTYIYNLGDGDDIIEDVDGNDTIKFGEGINKEDLIVQKVNNNSLKISFKNSSGSLMLNYAISNNNYAIENFEFANGDKLTLNDIKVLSLIGLDENDTIIGYNDMGGIIKGGKGNDTLNGGNKDEVYRYNLGDGDDIITEQGGNNIIEFGDGISKDDISVRRYNNGLKILIHNKNNQGSITITNDISKAVVNIIPISEIKFANGETLSFEEIRKLALIGSDNADTTSGYIDMDNFIDAKAGNDTIYGGDKNDTITGGKGNDTLNGGNGDDTYIYNLGDGDDIITEQGGNNIIEFGDGISKDDISVRRYNNGLKILIHNKNNQGSITITNDISKAVVNIIPISEIKFANGETLSFEEIRKLALIGSDNADTTSGYIDMDNFIDAKAGNDTIYGGDKNDTITGGKGNDTLNGGNGDDTYIYNLGDGVDTITETNGNDTIKFGEGINKDDLIVQRVNSNGEINTTSNLTDIKISFKSSPNDSVILKSVVDANVTNSSNAIENFEFKNGDKLSFDDIKKLSLIGLDENETISGYSDQNNTIYGNAGDDILNGKDKDDTINGGNGNDTIYAGNGDDNVGGDDGDDTLYGNNGNDTLIGGTGNDTLNGGNGDDTYIYNLGDGVDTITETNGNDTIKFGEGINKDDLIVQRVNSNGEINTTSNLTDIKISFKSSPNDSVILKSVVDANVTNSNYAIENFEFKNGDKLSFDDIKKLSLKNKVSNDEFKGYNDIENAITGLDSSDIINGGELSDSLYGNGGDDEIYSYGGDDTIDLGDGNDTVYAGYGNDTIIGGRGDDILKGEYGSDTYIYNLGDGNDTISEQGNYYQDDTDVDTLIFGQGIKKEDLLVFRKPYDLNLDNDDSQDDFNQIDRNLVNLVIKFKNSPNDSITIENAISDGKIDTNNTLKAFKFANGDELNIDDIANLAMKGSDTDDIIYAFKNENFIINAGKGNDIIYGSTNNEIYEFGLGDGNDTIIERDLNNPNLIVSDSYDIIRFKDDVNKDDIKFYFDGDDLLIKNEKSNDSIRVKRYFNASNDTYKINKIEFANGEFLTSNDIDNLAIKFGTNEKDSIYGYKDANDHIFALNADDSVFGFGGDDYIDGGDGNDYLSGGNGMQMDSGNDTLIGGNGDDTLRGEDGDDTLIGGSGNNKYIYESGNDTIVLSKGANDILFLQNDVNKDDLILSTNASKQDLIIKFKNNDKNSIVVKDYFTYKNLRIQPSKGYLISYAQIKAMLKNTPTTSPNTHDNQADNLGNNPNIPSDNQENPQNNNQDNLTPQSGTIKGDNNTNDTLYGDGGDNVFVFTKGQDTIIDQGGYDKLIFKDGINFSQIGNHIMSNGQDLIFRLNGSSDDEVTIKDFFNNPSAIIEEFVFETGGSISAAQIYSLFGLEIPQNIKKTDPTKLTYQDINLNHQNNTLTISGGNYSISDKGGRDTIILSGYNKEDVSFQKIANDLSIKYGDDNYLMIRNQSNKNNAIETIKIEQSDGTTKFITSTQINKIIEQLNTYANDNGLTSITHDDIASNQNLMQLVMSGWGN